jgi:hypothetical protein
MRAITERLLKLCTLSSQFTNVLLFNGHPDETICGRAYREGRTNWVRVLDGVFGKGHCKASHMLDIEFARLMWDWTNNKSID